MCQLVARKVILGYVVYHFKVVRFYKGSVHFVKGGTRFKIENRGTIVVLQRYVKALCFLDVLEMVVR